LGTLGTAATKRPIVPAPGDYDDGEYVWFTCEDMPTILETFVRCSFLLLILKSLMPTVFFYLVCEVIGTAATPGLLCQPRVIVKMIVEKQMECRLAEETEVLGKNLPQRHFCPSQNPT
jgi:hypothetical protein